MDGAERAGASTRGEVRTADIALRQPQLAGARDAVRQLLPQPARAADAVLRAGRLHPHHAARTTSCWCCSPGSSSLRASCTPTSTPAPTTSTQRSYAYGGRRARALRHVGDLRRAHPERGSLSRCAPGARLRLRPRFSKTFSSATARPPWRWPTGARRTASPAPATATPSARSSTTRCGASASIAARMGADTPRALALGAAARAFGMSADEVGGAADGSEHALAAAHRGGDAPGSARLCRRCARRTSPATIPEWLLPSFERAFGAGAAERARR